MESKTLLFEEISLYIKKEIDLKMIEKAYEFACLKHEGQKRKSGECYIVHPIEVTRILAKLKVGPDTLCAGLLHDIVEDTDVTVEEIKELFNEDISLLVDGLTKVSKLRFNSLVKHQAVNHQKMLLAMGKDIRVIVIKLADRLHNMRTLDVMTLEKRIRISEETLEIFAPIAHKLGMFKLKEELEELSFKNIDPEMHDKIEMLIKEKKNLNLISLETIIEQIKIYLEEFDIKDYKIKGRVKSTYSIYKKMHNQNKQFEDIYDILAIRVIVDKIENCYKTLGIIHANFTPIPMRFKDYIALPKQNMYQSLHTTIIGKKAETFEVQIRTEEMDRVAELGIAAHWSYKENVTYSKEKEQFEIGQKLHWYKELLDLSNDEDTIVETFKGDILDANIYVYTPKGEVVALVKGSTPLDFAYKIHTDIGHRSLGAIVNNKIVPLTYELKNGDIITMKLKATPQPSIDWLNIVKTNYAKNKIKTFINKQNKDLLIEKGKQDLEKELLLNNINKNLINESFVLKHFQKNLINTLDELYNEIGKGIISVKTVVQKCLFDGKIDKEAILEKQIEKNSQALKLVSDTGVIVEGLTNPKIKLGQCCNPIPEDEIVGYVSKTNGLVIHRKVCHGLQKVNQDRLLEVQWSNYISRKYSTNISIVAIASPTVLANIVSTINAYGVSIASINAINRDLELIINLKILVKCKVDLNVLFVNLKKIEEVIGIQRL